jgi:hypothetical protein
MHFHCPLVVASLLYHASYLLFSTAHEDGVVHDFEEFAEDLTLALAQHHQRLSQEYGAFTGTLIIIHL